MKKSLAILIIGFLTFVASCGGGNSSVSSNDNSANRKWLVLIYMDGDNNLSDATYGDLYELSQVNYPDSIKVVVLVDRNGYKDGKIYESVNGKLQITSNTPFEPDMGNPQTLIDFVETYETEYPAERTALVLWDHGDGWRGIDSNRKSTNTKLAAQDVTDDDYLFMLELKEALQQIKDDGYDLNLIGFDECLMGMTEVLYDIKDYANAFVASEAEEPGDGWAYDKVMSKLVSNPDADAYTFGKYIVDAFSEYYKNSNECKTSNDGCTLAVYTKEQVGRVVSDVNQIAQSYSSSNFSEFQNARNGSTDVSDTNSTYIDLKSFADNLQKVSAAVDLSSTVSNLYKTLINTNLQGISIYFPKTKQSDFGCYCATSNNPAVCDYGDDTIVNGYYNPFAENYWDEFLRNYYNDEGG